LTFIEKLRELRSRLERSAQVEKQDVLLLLVKKSDVLVGSKVFVLEAGWRIAFELNIAADRYDSRVRDCAISDTKDCN